jgi:hypothetical protein
MEISQYFIIIMLDMRLCGRYDNLSCENVGANRRIFLKSKIPDLGWLESLNWGGNYLLCCQMRLFSSVVFKFVFDAPDRSRPASFLR